ncbi:MAG: dihydrodipicolinate reductase [Candidatus Kryptonium sp.]|nr:dihydrodipicolinate reductase [Candidatus Kryptonium sp.]MCX7762284.1 dihydrodipicolinate reductase [Candidatus Kryptonium sp.]
MKRKINAVQFGLGPIGQLCAKTIIQKHSDVINLVGAVDINPNKIGKDIGELIGIEPTGILVEDDIKKIVKKRKVDLVFHTTTSFMEDVKEQIVELIKLKLNIVSSTEELFFPWIRNREIAHEIDSLAKKFKVRVLGTGVNPGFVMDVLPSVLTQVCTEVKRIRVERVVNAAKRRLPLQLKIGAGLRVGEFKAKKATGKFGHIGLVESLQFLAYILNINLDEIKEDLNPIVTKKSLKTEYLTIQKGRVAGIHHTAVGFKNGKEVISLDLKMYVGNHKDYDAVYIDGEPPIKMKILNGVFGDIATVASLINCAYLIFNAKPGLLTMADIGLPHGFLKQ